MAGQVKKKRRGCGWYMAGYGLAAVFYGAAGFASFLLVLFALTAGNEVLAVPELRGRQRAEAEAQLPPGLTLRVIDESCSLPAGTIFGQNPLPGKKVKLPHQIEVLVSKGSDQRPVPDLINLPIEFAIEQLERNGLKAGTVQEVEAAESPVLDGAVLETRPPAGTMLPVGGKIDLVVRREARAELEKVPDLVGRRLSEMESLTRETGLKLDGVTSRPDYDRAPGTIIEQNPAAGTPISEGMTLHLVVASPAEDGAPGPVELGSPPPAASARAVPLYFVVPPGVGSYEVRVVQTDGGGEREVFRDTCEPGRRLLINLSVSGRGYAYIYVAGQLNRVVPL